ncbi:hypothetical protein SYNPS1DRAFT_21767 [Syncephalis pseudoplumigaleata]|uniref:Uncharacterized protein n=1 Tax=Syncephalis pseudoplumigaleata TaxID=1712513 RepID=A0A4P9Z1W6_9FUNG|nr:hypothetical protein SYNPS1DRAFT_21767 [Syncephalis pseudoplumigaleata]|eukprot:RKP26483.1 hypothetical protein SYNPS1DRAFT_21767 [Syncephalis pseudoplumigaleata]
MTPLGLAAFLGKPRTVELLLTTRSPVTVDGRDMERRTALMHAVANGKREVTHVLLRHGASALAVDQHGQSVVALAEKAAQGPQATAAHIALHKLCQETAQKQSLLRAQIPPAPAMPPPPSTQPPEVLLRQNTEAKEAATRGTSKHRHPPASSLSLSSTAQGAEDELTRLADNFPLPPSCSPSASPAQPIHDERRAPALHVPTIAAIEPLPQAVTDGRAIGHTRTPTSSSSSQLRFSLIHNNSSTVVFVEGDVPHGSPLPRSPPPRLSMGAHGGNGHDGGHDHGATASLTTRGLHRRFQSHDGRSRVGAGDLVRRLTDPSVPLADNGKQDARANGQPSANEGGAAAAAAPGLRVSLTAVGQQSSTLPLPEASTETATASDAATAPPSHAARFMSTAARRSVRNTFGQAPDAIEQLVTTIARGEGRLSVYNNDDADADGDGDARDGPTADGGPAQAIASTDENETDGGAASARIRQATGQSTGTAPTTTGTAKTDAGIRLQMEIRQENINEIQTDIRNLKKQEMRAAQALRLAEDEQQLHAHDRATNPAPHPRHSLTFDTLSGGDEDDDDDDDGDGDTNDESGIASDSVDPLDAGLASPLSAMNMDERIMHLERKLRVQREEADEREELLEMQLRRAHDQWRQMEQRLRSEQSNAAAQMDELRAQLRASAERQNDVLHRAETLAEPWQLELPDGHRIYMAATSPATSPSPSPSKEDDEAAGARRHQRMLQALQRVRWQRDHLAEHLETYAHELRVQRERNEKLVRVVLEQVRKKLMDEETTNDLDHAIWVSSADTVVSDIMSPLGSTTSMLSGATADEAQHSTDANGRHGASHVAEGKAGRGLLSSDSTVSARLAAASSPSAVPLLRHRVTASEADVALADHIRSGMAGGEEKDGARAVESRRLSMLVAGHAAANDGSPAAMRRHRMRNERTSSEDMRVSTKLWSEAARRRNDDPAIADSLERLTRLRAEITILEKTVLQANPGEPNADMHHKMNQVLARKRKEYMNKMRALSELCGQPLAGDYGLWFVTNAL